MSWSVDPMHTQVEFSAKHMGIMTVRGAFTGVNAAIDFKEDNFTASSVEATIDATTLSTHDKQRDGHLKSPDFLDVEHFPTIIFKSTRIQGTRDEFKLIGDLTIRDQTREVALDVTFNGIDVSPYGQTVAGFSGQTKLNRKDFGLNWNAALESGGVLVSDQFKLEVEIEAVKQAA